MNYDFFKLLNLAMEMDERKIIEFRLLKEILERERLKYKEGEKELYLMLYNKIITLKEENLNTKPIWSVLDEIVILEKDAIC